MNRNKLSFFVFLSLGLGLGIYFFQHNKKASDIFQLQLENANQKITQTVSLSQIPSNNSSTSSKDLLEIIKDPHQDGDRRVAATSLLIQSWSEKDKEDAIQFILSSPFHSGATRITEFEITLRALVLEAFAESPWGKNSLPDLQKIAAFSESSFLSQRAELYRKWLSGLGPDPQRIDQRVLMQILASDSK